jgi:hypothetical protein
VRDIRSTKNGLSKSIRRFRKPIDLRSNGALRVVLDPGFSGRLGTHWRFLGARLFQPVRLNFRQPGNPFAQLRWPQQHQSQSANYAFFSRIQLTFPLAPINTVFLKTNTSNFQSSSRFETVQNPAVERTKTSVFATEFWSTLFHFGNRLRVIARRSGDGRDRLGQASRRAREQTPLTGEQSFLSGEPGRQPVGVDRAIQAGTSASQTGTTLVFRERERLSEKLSGILHTWTYGERSRSRAPLFVTLPRTVQRLSEFLNSETARFSSSHYESEKLAGGRSVVPGRMRVLLRSLLDPSRLARTVLPLQINLKSIHTVQPAESRQSFLRQNLVSEFRQLFASQKNSYMNVNQQFAASKGASAEMSARQVQYFGPSIDFSYARTEQPQLQNVVNALREMRPSQNEMKTQTPTLPSIAQLTSQVRQELEREIRIERERRGL